MVYILLKRLVALSTASIFPQRITHTNQTNLQFLGRFVRITKMKTHSPLQLIGCVTQNGNKSMRIVNRDQIGVYILKISSHVLLFRTEISFYLSAYTLYMSAAFTPATNSRYIRWIRNIWSDTNPPGAAVAQQTRLNWLSTKCLDGDYNSVTTLHMHKKASCIKQLGWVPLGDLNPIHPLNSVVLLSSYHTKLVRAFRYSHSKWWCAAAIKRTICFCDVVNSS